jgi:hypothetical protein
VVILEAVKIRGWRTGRDKIEILPFLLSSMESIVVRRKKSKLGKRNRTRKRRCGRERKRSKLRRDKMTEK